MTSLNAIQVWSLTSVLGVLLFALALGRMAPGDPASVGSRPWWSLRSAPPNPGFAPTTPLRAERHSASAQAAEPVATNEPREPIKFAKPPRKGVVRSTVAYRLVRVTDGPVDHDATEIGRLDRGDEVEVIGDSEGYLKVRTPSGLEGWVPRMVLVG